MVGTNPLAFLRLFTKSAVVKKCAALYACMQFQQGTQVSDMNLVFMANDLKFSQRLMNLSVTAYGTM